jgi:hypothetical protein
MAVDPSNTHLLGPGITRVAVTGFKSLATKADVEVRPMTVLAGANSSGKSSLVQPLLLMKQTFDIERIPPGPFWLRGEQVGYDTADQFLSSIQSEGETTRRLKIELEADGNWAELSFAKKLGSDLEVVETASRDGIGGQIWRVNRDSSQEELERLFESVTTRQQRVGQIFGSSDLVAHPDRCFLGVGTRYAEDTVVPTFHRPEVNFLRHKIQDMIHIPGLRGSEEREFYLHGLPLGNTFPGEFEDYVPSILEAWKDETKYANGLRYLYELSSALRLLELASGIDTRKLNESQIEVRVPRTLEGDPKDLVNVGDVGLAVSQILPVLVAVVLANPSQLVHIEQPEIHLHPRAQLRLAQLLAEAANRGVRLVIETHSSLLLRGILTEIAKDKISNDKVVLHWFERDRQTGLSTVHSAWPDRAGRVGDWPEDFGDVELGSDNDYLGAVEGKLLAGKK